MNVFEMTIVLVFLGIVYEMYRQWLKHQRKSAPADDGRLAHLEERVRVLEQIVTDSGYDLRRQFRDLERNG